MKQIFAFVFIFVAATTFGCNDAVAPKNEVRVESASEAARNDSRAIAGRLAQQKAAVDEAFERTRALEARQRNVDALRAVSARWLDGLDDVSRIPRSDLAESIKKLRAIKTEAETVEVDDCTGKARATLVSSMTASIEAASMFQKEGGTARDATGQKLQQGADSLFAAQREMDTCQSK